MSWLRKRRFRIGLAFLALLSGIGVRVILDGPVAKNGGVLLYAVFIYALVAVFALRLRPINVAWVALAVCWAVESFQRTGVPQKWAEYSFLSRLAFGTTFLWQDLPWYAVGAAAAMCLHQMIGNLAGLRRVRRLNRQNL